MRRTLVFCCAVLALALAVPPAASASERVPGVQAEVAKKKCKKRGKKKCKRARRPAVVPPLPVTAPPPPPPAPLPLTEAEVTSRVNERAGLYCAQDVECTGDFGWYVFAEGPNAGHLACDVMTASRWACFGWWDWDDGDPGTCDFREVVDRVGQNGISSFRDGLDCYYLAP